MDTGNLLLAFVAGIMIGRVLGKIPVLNTPISRIKFKKSLKHRKFIKNETNCSKN
jgi:hypothetical protein